MSSTVIRTCKSSAKCSQFGFPRLASSCDKRVILINKQSAINLNEKNLIKALDDSSAISADGAGVLEPIANAMWNIKWLQMQLNDSFSICANAKLNFDWCQRVSLLRWFASELLSQHMSVDSGTKGKTLHQLTFLRCGEQKNVFNCLHKWTFSPHAPRFHSLSWNWPQNFSPALHQQQ